MKTISALLLVQIFSNLQMPFNLSFLFEGNGRYEGKTIVLQSTQDDSSRAYLKTPISGSFKLTFNIKTEKRGYALLQFFGKDVSRYFRYSGPNKVELEIKSSRDKFRYQIYNNDEFSVTGGWNGSNDVGPLLIEFEAVDGSTVKVSDLKIERR